MESIFFIVSVNLRSLCIQLYVFLNLQTSARFPLYAECIPALEFSVNPWIIFSSMFLFSLRVFFLCFEFVLGEAVNWKSEFNNLDLKHLFSVEWKTMLSMF